MIGYFVFYIFLLKFYPMKRIIYLFIFIFSFFFSDSYCQKSSSKRKKSEFVQVISPQKFYLNSASTITGTCRTEYKLTLPPGTKDWYFSVTTSKGNSPAGTINLLSQLTRLYDPTGTTAIVSELILTPPGTGYCDLYLMDYNNLYTYKNRPFKKFYYYDFRKNFVSGTVNVNNLSSGTYYLLFYNPNMMQGVNITLEVVALVER